ncbi:stimulator of interferon genes protein-like isoform X2 [Stylophora pistillata]|uniref:Stimulator of interferon genes protein 7 n=1 Tax=Stylophora pistillata TaxID=50429 RepID=STNG7_STYPI|nr:stimulator of interferon genes protein-like isoform X1 [Stylophora pistillata]XP_022784638.1 stimulator of interferon genes protein-like isoform X2 [Stylophora pistillata]PFX29186.1 Stimulator of interferon genes protein [Stylophora pistillata]
MAENLLPRGDDLAQQENNGFGPLFKRRGRTAAITSAIIGVSSGAMLFLAVKEEEKKTHFLVFTAALLTLSFAFGELLRRLSLVSEEIQHKHTRHQGKWKSVFKTTFTFDHGGCISLTAMFSALILCYQLYEQYEVFSRSDFAILFSVNCLVVPQLLFLVGLRQLSPVETSDLNEKENKNVADGLAWSYYFGYLKLVLPHLKDQIAKSEQFRYKIKKKKLFILLPKTCFTHADIVDADPRVKWAGNLPELKISRGGIKDRIYKHAVHKIEMPRPDGTMDEYHFILEYATSLMTLYDMSQHADAPLSRKERDHQVVLFIRKLREILDKSEECRGSYELVPISGNDPNEIANVLVGMHNAANIEVLAGNHDQANGVIRPE